MLQFPLSSDRLLLRPFVSSDVEAMRVIYGDPRVMTYVGTGAPVDRGKTTQWLNEYQEHQLRYGIGVWAVVERETDTVIGDAGFDFRLFDNQITCELGYTFGRQWWGKGYATEVASLCLEAAIGQLGIPEVTAIVDVDHPASAQVLQKLGFHQTTERIAHNRPHLEFRLAADEWAKQTGSSLSTSLHPSFTEADNVSRLLHLVEHPSSEVRLDLAMALPSAVNYESRPDVAQALVCLTSDDNDDVRNWACFGLGQLRSDGDHVREALFARIEDDHDETRGEAFVALAQLGDQQIIAPLLRRLTGDSVWTLEIEAAGVLADPSLYVSLLEIEKWWKDDNDDLDKLQFALRRCHPEAVKLAASHEKRLLDRIRKLSAIPSMDIRIENAYPLSTLVTEDGGVVLDTWLLWDDRDPFTDADGKKDSQQWLHNVESAVSLQSH